MADNEAEYKKEVNEFWDKVSSDEKAWRLYLFEHTSHCTSQFVGNMAYTNCY